MERYSISKLFGSYKLLKPVCFWPTMYIHTFTASLRGHATGAAAATVTVCMWLFCAGLRESTRATYRFSCEIRSLAQHW